MSSRPKFTDAALVSVLGDRARRVRLIGETAQGLLAGRLPAHDAALFVGGALMSWLENGGSLERDFLKVVKAKSHRTPRAIWREIRAHPDEDLEIALFDTVAPKTSRRERRN